MAEQRRAKERKGRRLRTLVAAALTAAVVAGSTGWAVGSEQEAVTGPVPGVSSWRADRTADPHGRPLPDPATASPARIAGFFAGLTEQRRRTLVERHALVVGNLDGAPPKLRYAANSRALREERSQQLDRAADEQQPEQDRAAARARAERYAELLAPGRQILAFDPRGRGQVAEVYGDLDAAEHVSVIVPGSDIDLGTFDRKKDRYGTPTGMGRSLYAATGHRTAVIAWAGYTTPVGLGPDAATGRLAEAGAPRLARLAQGVVAAGGPRPALFCHSYGSVVCGLAAPQAPASDLVVAGSPGMRVERAADLRTEARVWAAKDPGDWIDNVPHVQVLGLGHGTDPADPSFGARPVPSAEADGHTGYFAPGTDSLRAFADIALGASH
ncbi:alpha/beta hydrolase [Streptomyces luteolus]|uniref:Alpha/beta hydrolase n=1 Tax=Streptomyces luteolus TaxID=3043615 RepID=A0ABT6SYY7_9ACTN|nr:alpha/beta hydrolase [Streptomyces sp. B-S-A12]MDI3419862.1 alpha/beta hydrolase [Streptomyces sp. B-S-A12]